MRDQWAHSLWCYIYSCLQHAVRLAVPVQPQWSASCQRGLTSSAKEQGGIKRLPAYTQPTLMPSVHPLVNSVPSQHADAVQSICPKNFIRVNGICGERLADE
jgi:hypothetical protein